MSLKLELTVAAIAEDRGRFLFVQERAARRIVLNQPAGHVEPGESLAAAVVREAREETGREFRPTSVTGIYLWQGPAGRTTLRVAFAGSVAERDVAAALDRAILRTLWLDRAELAGRAAEHRSPLVLQCVDDYLRGARYPLELLNHVPLDGLPALRTAG
ncbi:MAG TPA: NUDIX hydrolase [Steroidobacteraceae bacterium]|jgi:8-oxo-dGTP pyrophosphatase MutT (NUDIX family)|nr:NUDIX hydrolase [Steroidobacteraceae bacterium]